MPEDILNQPGFINEPPKKKGIVKALMKRLNLILEERPNSNIPRELVNTTETGASDALFASISDKLWRVRHDRRSIYHDLKEMDENDPLISTALDVIASCVTGFEDTTVDGFEWTMEVTNAKAMEVLENLKLSLDMGQEAWHVTRGFVRNGEEFREVVVQDETVVRFKYLPPWTVMPKFDQWGNKIPGWEQRPEGTMPNVVIDFEEWQIIPFLYGAKRGYFGTGLMMPGRRTWRRLQKMEDGMAIARMTRAYDKLLHKVPVKSEWDSVRQQKSILDYKGNMTRRRGLDSDGNVTSREKPLEVETDFYIPDDGSGKGNIEILAAQNMQLMNIDDVEHHQSLLLCRLKVPRKMLNLGSGQSGALTDSGLSAEDIQFARELRQAQAILRTGFMRLAYLALVFQGFDPDQLRVGIRLAKISTQDHLQNAKVAVSYGQAARFFADVLGGLPFELVADKFMDLSDEHKEILKGFVAEKEEEAEEAKARQMELEDRNHEIQKAALTARAATGRGTGTNTSGPASPFRRPENPRVQDVVEAVTSLQMMVQSELEKNGVEFNLGVEERRAENLEHLVDTVFETEG